MMPRLIAEETLTASTATALGSGTLGRAEASRITAGMMRAAHAGTPAIRPSPTALAAIGIGYEEG